MDPTVSPMQGEFSLFSHSASVQLNEHQVFVFGGYNEEADNEITETSFILDCKFQLK